MEDLSGLQGNTILSDGAQVLPDFSALLSFNINKEPSEFEKSSVPSPDSPFSIHLDKDEDPHTLTSSACENLEGNHLENHKSDEDLESERQAITMSPEVSDSPVDDGDDAVLFSLAIDRKSQSFPQFQESNTFDNRGVLNNEKHKFISSFSGCSRISNKTDEELFSPNTAICPVLALSESPVLSLSDKIEKETSKDPLALPISVNVMFRKRSLTSDHLEKPNSKRIKLNESEKTKLFQSSKKLSMWELQVRLAKVTRCNEKDLAAVILKATSTINELRQQGNDFLSVYTKLKLENQELFQTKKKLAGDVGEMPESVLSLYSIVTFDSRYSDVETANGMDAESGILDPTLEPYEETYDAPIKISFQSELPLENNNCGHIFCRFGSLCEGLSFQKKAPEHCGHPHCMLEPHCIRPENLPSNGTSRIIAFTDPYYTKGKNQIRAPSSTKASFLPSDVVNDVKLKQKCSVRIQRLMGQSDPPVKVLTLAHPVQSIPSMNYKLTLTPDLPEGVFQLQSCYVHLERLPIVPNSRIYCMEHSKYQCKCLGRTNTKKRKRGK